MPSISNIYIQKIFDSRGEWTVRVSVELDNKMVSHTDVPQYKIRGPFDAKTVELDEVLGNIKEIAPMFRGMNIQDQYFIDRRLALLNSSKSGVVHLGMGAIFGISLSCARLAAIARGVPLWSYIRGLFGASSVRKPQLFITLIDGGNMKLADLGLEECFLIPQTESFIESIKAGLEFYQRLFLHLERVMKMNWIGVGDNGGLVGGFKNSKEIFKTLLLVADELELKELAGFGISITMEGWRAKSGKLVELYSMLSQDFGVIYFEDPFSGDDFHYFSELKRNIAQGAIISGGRNIGGEVDRMRRFYEQKAINCISLSPIQTGTLTDFLSAVRQARSWGWSVVISHTQGETNDDFSVDIGYAVGADGIKIGGPARGDRIAKYNRLLAIEQVEDKHTADATEEDEK